MDALELKALQAPLKERYKTDPAAAVVTLRAQGRIGEGIACRLDTGRALIEAGFREVRLKLELDSDAPEEQLKKLIELTERYCVVMQTIRNSPPVVVSR